MLKDWQIIQYTNQLRENISFNYIDPVSDIDKVLEDAGYKYVEEHFKDDFSGFSKYLGSGNYVIGFNKDHYWSEKFRRFTIAHELGHLTIPEHRLKLEKEILHRSKTEYKSTNNIEIEADKFAINFLAPKQTFKEKSKYKRFNSDTINILSDYFNISTYATALHFIDSTDLACVLIVNNKNGQIVYERRSKRFTEGFYHPYLHRQAVPQDTNCFTYLNDDQTIEDIGNEQVIDLKAWYPELNSDIQAFESIIDLGYNNFIFSLIEPHKSVDEDE